MNGPEKYEVDYVDILFSSFILSDKCDMSLTLDSVQIMSSNGDK